MNRRSFISLLAGGIAAGAAVRTFPFRVYSFPSDIVPAPLKWTPSTAYEVGDLVAFNEVTYKYITRGISPNIFTPSPLFLGMAMKYGWDRDLDKPKVEAIPGSKVLPLPNPRLWTA